MKFIDLKSALLCTNEQDQLSIANNTIVQLNSQVLLSKQEIEKLKGELVTLTKQKAEMKTDWEKVMARETEVLKTQADSVKDKADSITSQGHMAVVIPSVLAATALGVSLFKK